jgi:NADH-quinone oxidoreductase subunit E
LLPILHIAQAENEGWLSAEAMDLVASIMGIQAIEVFEVASFYSMYNLQPIGKCHLEVCRTSSCWARGAEDIVDYISKKLNIKVGETTSDGMFTLKTVECLGSCGSAPMLQCGAEYHENLTESKVDDLLERMRSEGKRRNYTDLDYKNSK